MASESSFTAEQIDHLVRQGSELLNNATVLIKLLAEDTKRAIASTVEHPEIEKMTLEARKKRLEADMAEAEARITIAKNSALTSEINVEENNARLEVARTATVKARAEKEKINAELSEFLARKAKANLEQVQAGIERRKLPQSRPPARKTEVDRRREQTSLGAPIKGIEQVKLEPQPKAVQG